MKRILHIFGPGLLIAATGVGAGDLATSALAGANIGYVAIIAVFIGGVFKYFLNVGLARWQFTTQSTLIEGAVQYYGKWARYAFLIYLILWSFTVAVALMSAGGIALHSLIPLLYDAAQAKVIYGIGLSLVGLLMVRVGGFRFFERLMGIAVMLMLAAIFYAVFKLDIPFSSPVAFEARGNQWEWFAAVLGGVGGTVTVLCYGYWIREHNREGEVGLKVSRIDLMMSYLITVLLGISMVLVGSQIRLEGGGAGLLVKIAGVLESNAGSGAAWIFKTGAFAAIFSSLLGVWQSVPYLFTDLLFHSGDRSGQEAINDSKIYRWFLYGLAIIPMLGLPFGFASIQKLYALTGALFIPMLALTLILLSRSINNAFRNSIWLNLVYGLILIFSVIMVLKVML